VRDVTITLATALDAALLQLVEHIDDLRTALAANRAAFVRTSTTDLDSTTQEHKRLADRVHALEKVVAERRAELCAALGQPTTARMRTLLTLLPATVARKLADTAERLRMALHTLRVEGAVGQRLLDVSRRAQESVVQTLAAATKRAARRYDRHARSISSGQAGDLVRGTV
jgi:hypothetical protein